MRYFFFSAMIFICSACYSFTGGTIPSHLKTMQVVSVVDNSGFGNPEYKVELETELFNKLQQDGSFKLTEDKPDAKLSVVIVSVQETPQTIGAGELETERKITMTVSAEYYDNINNKQMWKKSFSNYGLFDVMNASVSRKNAIEAIIPQLAEDIVLGIVSEW